MNDCAVFVKPCEAGNGLTVTTSGASRMRAERRAGEMLAKMDRRDKGETDKKIMLHDETLSLPKLEDLGIPRIQSHPWLPYWQ